MEDKPQIEHLPDGQLNLPPNAVPLVVLFLVPANESEKEAKIGIIVNDKADPNLIQNAIEQAQKIIKDRKTHPQVLQGGQEKSTHPKLTDILGS